ncbi:MAG: hypothetical protein QOE92_1689 [Chloroflexota bacterium]|nr:hypothetical protein [Chloroflexota bacterium]
MKAWDRNRDGLDDLELTLSDALGSAGVGEQGKLSVAAATPQTHPALPQNGGVANSAIASKPTRRRRAPGHGEIDVHIRIPARFRERLQVRRRELGTSLTGTILELVRRGLEEPPPGLANLRRRDVRQDLVEEAVLATLLAIEQTRLQLEQALPEANTPADSSVHTMAAWQAEQRLAVARAALGEMKR